MCFFVVVVSELFHFKLLVFGHRTLIKNKTQTAVINIKNLHFLTLTFSFPFGNVLNFYCRCSLSRFQTPIVTV